MIDYFGKGCTFFKGWWAEDKNTTPTRVRCSHYRNKLNEEGNCKKEFCPKLLKNKKVGSNMKKIFALAVCLAVMYGTVLTAEEKPVDYSRGWTWSNTLMEASFIGLTFIDMRQNVTAKDVKNDKRKQFNLYSYYGCIVLCHVAASWVLPEKYRDFWMGASIAMEVRNVYNNYNLGLTAGYTFKF